MLRIKTEPTTAEKVKETALSVAALASDKAQEVAKDVAEKTNKDIAPALAAKAEDVVDTVKDATAPHLEKAKDAAAPHVEKVKDVAAAKAEDVKNAAEDAKKAAAERAEAVSDAAAERRKDAEKAAKKQAKAAKKEGKSQLKQARKDSKKLQKKATKKFGIRRSQDVAYKAAGLRGQAAAFAEDKGLTTDNVRDTYQDDILPHLKELLAAAAGAAATARSQAGDVAQTAFANLPSEAQDQVAKVAPALAKKQKKGGKGLIILGLGALGGAGYLYYTDQNKRKASNAQLSETAIADSQATTDDARTINNPVTNFKHADDTTVVRPAAGSGAGTGAQGVTGAHAAGATTATTGTTSGVTSETVAGAATEAGEPGTAAAWDDTNADGHLTAKDLEGETRASRREHREGH